MRIAILSDIHGNDIALRAVLDDIKINGDVDAYWILGDLVAIGHAPIKVLEIIQSLSNTAILRGNTDRYICTGDRPLLTAEHVPAGQSLIDLRIEVEADFSWTQGAVTVAGWLDWLSNLPMEYCTKLPDRTRVLCVHASPGQDAGSGVSPETRDRELETLLAGCQEDLICVGHTHRPFSRYLGNQRLINPGSLSNPIGPDRRASYAILEADKSGYEIGFHRVAYDYQAVIDILVQINHPGRRLIIEHNQR
jgi:putative phosphoesterase